MKKLLFILLALPLFSFGQTKWGIGLNGTPYYYIGDTVRINVSRISGDIPTLNSVVNVKIINNLLTTQHQEFNFSFLWKDFDNGNTPFKFVIPDSLHFFDKESISLSITANNGSAAGVVVKKITAGLINPFLPENKDNEYNFYSQTGLLIKKCKVSDLAPGFYISNGFKIYKN